MKEYSEFIIEYTENYGRYQIAEENLSCYVTYLLANFCMPTLINIKPSTLVHINRNSISDAAGLLAEIGSESAFFDCSCSVLYENDQYLILLIYNREHLDRVISSPEGQQFLNSFGYELHGNEVDNAIRYLTTRYQGYERYHVQEMNYFHEMNYSHTNHHPHEIRYPHDIRYSNEISYPHEIGLLLGFPLQDVEDFIRYHGMNYLYCGYWKVYHNVEEAKKIFESYRSIREAAIRSILTGRKLKDMKRYLR